MADAKTETIRIRIDPRKKVMLTEMYNARGTTISTAVRDFLDSELASAAHPLDRFDAIMASADAKLEAYGAPEPSLEDIVSFVEDARKKRAGEFAVA